MTIRVAIVEDHHVVAEALATMLSFAEDIEMVGYVGSAAAACQLTRDHRPDVVLMDITLDGDVDGIAATSQLLEIEPGLAVIVLSMHDDADSVARAVAGGAVGYLPKNTTNTELLAAIRTAAGGGGYIHPTVTRPLLHRISPSLETWAASSPALTRQEHRVLQALADGNTTRNIAALLTISEETVKTHLTRIYQKLGVADRTQAVALGLRRGLVK